MVDSILYPLYNKPYNSRKLCEKLIDVLNLYREKGFSLADVQDIDFNKNTGVLYLTFDEGMISKIKIEGNDLTDPTVIYRRNSFKRRRFFSLPANTTSVNKFTNNKFI